MAHRNTFLYVASSGWSELIPARDRLTNPPARLGYTMVQLHDGIVLMFGGSNKNEGSRSFMADTWLLTLEEAPLPARSEHQDTAISAIWNEILPPTTHIGQRSSNNGAASWPKGRMGHAMTSMGANKVLLYGGCIGDEYHSSCVTFLASGVCEKTRLLDDTWLYDYQQ